MLRNYYVTVCITPRQTKYQFVFLRYYQTNIFNRIVIVFPSKKPPTNTIIIKYVISRAFNFKNSYLHPLEFTKEKKKKGKKKRFKRSKNSRQKITQNIERSDLLMQTQFLRTTATSASS
jgi:hypothetical protein